MAMTKVEREWHEAEIAWYNSERAKFEAQADRERALAEGARITAEREALELASERRKEARLLAGDYENRVLRFNDSVTESSVNNAISTLNVWDRITPECPVTIYFNSPGGSVVPGMALFDEIRRLAGRHHITTVASGMAASMASILLQAGTLRVMAKESWLLLHQGSMGAIGSMGEVEDTVEWGKKIGKRIVDIYYERSQSSEAAAKLTRKQLEARMNRRDWWISSDEALDHGLTDEVQ